MSKELSEMSKEELWELFPIVLKKHNPDYKRWYEEEKEALLSALKKTDIERLSHIGSTAVKGLIAKPTVDVLLEISSNCEIRTMIVTLKDLGWTLMSKESEPFHLIFNKGYTKEGFAEKVYHLHVRYYDDWDELYFRDYLKLHPETVKAYGELKVELKEKYEHDRDAYTNSKTNFVTKYSQKARDEFGNRYQPKNHRTNEA